jgi:hypothetical protein
MVNSLYYNVDTCANGHACGAAVIPSLGALSHAHLIRYRKNGAHGAQRRANQFAHHFPSNINGKWRARRAKEVIKNLSNNQCARRATYIYPLRAGALICPARGYKDRPVVERDDNV